MTISLGELLVAVAALLSPLVVIQVQKWLDKLSSAHERKLKIFKQLMTTRGDALAKEHVEALNMIELEFRDKKYRTVRTAWRVYLHHLNNLNPTAGDINKTQGLLASLLVAMSISLDYGELDEVDMLKGWYVPVKYSNDEDARIAFTKAAISFLENNKNMSLELVKANHLLIKDLAKNLKSPSQNDDIPE